LTLYYGLYYQGFSKLGHRQSQGIRWHGGEVL
jgi:hypothetical protein